MSSQKLTLEELLRNNLNEDIEKLQNYKFKERLLSRKSKHQLNACNSVVLPNVLSPKMTVTFFTGSQENSSMLTPRNCRKFSSCKVFICINSYLNFFASSVIILST